VGAAHGYAVSIYFWRSLELNGLNVFKQADHFFLKTCFKGSYRFRGSSAREPGPAQF
jgi:hypothetical protein